MASGLLPDRRLEGRQRLGQITQVAQGVAQIVEGGGKVRTAGDAALKLGRRLAHPTQDGKRIAPDGRRSRHLPGSRLWASRNNISASAKRCCWNSCMARWTRTSGVAVGELFMVPPGRHKTASLAEPVCSLMSCRGVVFAPPRRPTRFRLRPIDVLLCS